MTRIPSFHLQVVMLSSLVVVAGCGGSRRAGVAADASLADVGVDGGTSLGPDLGDPSACTAEPVRSVSEECCEAYGVDACGAGLFCAAFDGRTLATCYALGSRLNGDECGASEQCASGACSARGRCAAVPGETCNRDDGCAMVAARSYLCVDGSCVTSTGTVGSPCEAPIDCTSNYCVARHCTSGALGSACAAPSDCASAICVSAMCSSGAEGSPCETSAQCTGGLECRAPDPATDPFGPARCRMPAGGSCAMDSDCDGGGCFGSVCITGGLGAACDSNPDCVPNLLFPDMRCIRDRCGPPGASGEPCTEGNDCERGYCYPSGECL